MRIKASYFLNNGFVFCEKINIIQQIPYFIRLYIYQKLKNTNMALEITDSNFEELVLKSDKPVLVDFWAEWCGPCRMVGPIVEELSKDFDGKAVVGKVNVDHNSGISSNYGIRNIPTLLIFKNGEIVDKHVGAAPKNVLAAKIEAQL